VGDQKEFALKLLHYLPRTLLDELGMVIQFPVSQFPVEEGSVTKWYRLEKTTFVQKIMVGQYGLAVDGALECPLMFFVSPNEWETS
jgi:hypothetical protein